MWRGLLRDFVRLHFPAMAKAVKPKSRYAKSEKLFADAVKLMPGGVSSPVRSFKAVGASPVFIKEGKGGGLTDVDGNQYVDYVLSYGPLIAGHCPPTVRAAVAKQIDKGSSYGWLFRAGKKVGGGHGALVARGAIGGICNFG